MADSNNVSSSQPELEKIETTESTQLQTVSTQDNQPEEGFVQRKDGVMIKRHPGYGPVPEGMTKSAFKKMKRAQEREATRDEFLQKVRKKEREKKKAKKIAIRQGLIPRPPSKEVVDQVPSNLRVILDMDFDNLMLEKEISSVSRQIARCYSANKIAKHPVKLSVTSHNGQTKQFFDTRMLDSRFWKGVEFHEGPYIDIYPQEDLVYLTADSENILETLDETKSYIIGGIVDKNRHKLLTFNKANKQKITTAQLPIGSYINMATRKVLTVNHVFEILVNFLDCKDWKKAFLDVIPTRKFNNNENDDRSGDGELDEDDQDEEEVTEKNETQPTEENSTLEQVSSEKEPKEI